MMTHAKMGMKTLDQCLRDYYFERKITLETAMGAAHSPSNLQRLIAAGMSGDEGGTGNEGKTTGRDSTELGQGFM